MPLKILPLLVVLTYMGVSFLHAASHTEKELTKYLETTYERDSSEMCYETAMAHWNYAINLTPENSEKVTAATLQASKFNKDVYDEWFKDAKIDDIKNATVKRMLKELKLIGPSILCEADLLNLTEASNKMVKIYSTAKICPYEKQKCDLNTEGWNLEPEIQNIFESSTDYDELSYIWEAWRDASGKLIRPFYSTYVELNNKASKANGFEDYGKYWRNAFECEDFDKVVDEIWNQIYPLYKQLHSYTRAKLIERYGEKMDTKDALIPAHVLGDIWAQRWTSLEDILKPFPNEISVDITKALTEQNYTVKQMFETSNDFYMSLGLPSNEVSYDNDSMIERPQGKEVLCHPSAWSFCNSKDFRIKMCTQVTQRDFMTIHHEMGHIQYYILYKDQLNIFREGANPGFHETIGDTISLSAESIKHLKSINLLDEDYKETKKAQINNLLTTALSKIAFLPFGYIFDKWRWDVFAGTVPQSEWNKHWWAYREKYQLVKAPVERSEEDFDPAAKFHVAADTQFMSYFVSHVMQFQFYKGLCIAAGEYNPETKDPPLHKCDFYNNKAAGKLIKESLSLGSSKPWPEVLKIIAGTEKLDAGALLEFFEPLSNFFSKNGFPADR